MNQTWENGKKTNFRSNFGSFDWIVSLLDFRNCCKLSLRAISRKTNSLTSKNGEKNHVGHDLGQLGGHENFYSKMWLRQSLDIMVSYHYVQYQKKTNDPILRKLSDGQTYEQTDGRTDGRKNIRMDRQTGSRTRVISLDTDRLTSSVQQHFFAWWEIFSQKEIISCCCT